MKLLKLNEPTKNGIIYKPGCFKNIPERVPLFNNFSDHNKNNEAPIGYVEGVREDGNFLVATNFRGLVGGEFISNTVAPMFKAGNIKNNKPKDCELLSLSFIPDGAHSIKELNNNVSASDIEFTKFLKDNPEYEP